MIWKAVILTFLGFMCWSWVAAAPAEAVTVRNLTWTPNTEMGLAGYRLYLQNIHNAGATILLKEVGTATIQTTLTFRIPKTGVWQLVMTAFNNQDIEGPYSKPAYYVKTGAVAYWSAKGKGPTVVKGIAIP